MGHSVGGAACAELRALSAAAAASRLASSSNFITSNGAPFMAAWCSGVLLSCMAARSARPRYEGRTAACGRVCVRAAAYVVQYSGRIAVGLEQQARHLQRGALRSGVVHRQLPVLHVARRTRRSLGQGTQQQGQRGGEGGTGSTCVGPRCCGSASGGVDRAARRALSAAVAVAVALPSGPSSSFTTSNVAPLSVA